MNSRSFLTLALLLAASCAGCQCSNNTETVEQWAAANKYPSEYAIIEYLRPDGCTEKLTAMKIVRDKTGIITVPRPEGSRGTYRIWMRMPVAYPAPQWLGPAPPQYPVPKELRR